MPPTNLLIWQVLRDHSSNFIVVVVVVLGTDRVYSGLLQHALAKGAVMSDEFHFNGEDAAKAEIRAAVRYLLKGIAGSDRGDILREIIAIVNEVARGLPPGGQDPLDDGMPGG